MRRHSQIEHGDVAETKVLTIYAMKPDDWPGVRSIYEEGLQTGHATFETVSPAWDEWNARHHQFCRLVARRDDAIRGWTALSPVSSRSVYAGVAEVSIYVAASHRGQGAGGVLMADLVSASESAGIWTLQASIFPENNASIALHLRHGFRLVGRRERIGRLHGRWRDTVLLERRSSIIL